MFDDEFTSRYLVRYGFKNISQFREIGVQQFGDSKFMELCEAIDKFTIGLSLIGYGYDKQRSAHIFTVENPGTVINHDLLHYAIVGSEYYMASVSIRRKRLIPDLQAVIYRLLEAKFSAETATGVGKSTSVLTFNSAFKQGAMGAGAIDAVRQFGRKF